MLASDSEIGRRNLEQLLQVFGSQFSLKEIASAYCQSKGNIHTAARILCPTDDKTLSTIASTSGDNIAGASAMQLEFLCGLENSGALLTAQLSSAHVPENSYHAESSATTGALKSNNSCASFSTASTMIGNDYVRSPWKLDSKEFPVSSAMTTGNVDIDDFLLSSLEGGFHLDETIIQEVLGSCGYDVQKIVDKLVDLSASSLGNYDDVVGIVAEQFMEKCPVEGSFSEQGVQIFSDSAQSEGANSIAKYPCHTAAANNQELSVNEDEDDDNSFNALRHAAKEYWNTVREYYKAAADAFVKGDKAQSERLLEQGDFFNKKAREADEKSTQKMLEDSSRGDETMYLDLHNYKAREAVHLLRVHLTSISGIPSINYLKLIVGTYDEGHKFQVRKRMLIKQLEKESINWTEKDDGQTMIIRVDVINPKSLSFAKGKVNIRFPSPES